MYSCDNSLLNFIWAEKYFRENQNTHLMLHRFSSETVAFIGVIARNTAEQERPKNSCLPVDFVTLQHYCLRSTVYIFTVKSQHNIEIWTHSHFCFPFLCDCCMWPCSGKSYNGREDCSTPSQLTCYEQIFTNIHWPCVSSGNAGYPCVTSITVMKPTFKCERLCL